MNPNRLKMKHTFWVLAFILIFQEYGFFGELKMIARLERMK